MHNSKEISVEPITSLRSRLSQLSKSQTDQQPCIYKVYQHLRIVNDKAYEPQIVAIGPYHRGKDSLQMMEKHKLRYLESLLFRKNENVDLYISAIGGLEERARSCYSEPISLNAAEFVEMLVLDGCFIIELLRKYGYESSSENDPIIQMDWILSSLKRDFILFENQIPFFVLCTLFDLIESPGQHSTLKYLIRYFCHTMYPSSEIKRISDDVVGEEKLVNREIKHLLDFIHNNWRPSLKNDVEIKVDSVSCIRSALCCLKKKPSTSGREHCFIHSATELNKANVRFSKRKFDDDNSERNPDDNLFRIDFKKGVLVMPQLTVADRTESTFRNLIAYEQYFPDELHGNFVTDYVLFMDRLINTTRDVEILSKSKIIDNWMGDNEAVVDIFNKLTDSVTVRSTRFMYSGVVDRVIEHYERPLNHESARLRRDYFNSPWAAIAFFSALLLLLLTVAQTVCSVLQVV